MPDPITPPTRTTLAAIRRQQSALGPEIERARQQLRLLEIRQHKLGQSAVRALAAMPPNTVGVPFAVTGEGCMLRDGEVVSVALVCLEDIAAEVVPVEGTGEAAAPVDNGVTLKEAVERLTRRPSHGNLCLCPDCVRAHVIDRPRHNGIF